MARKPAYQRKRHNRIGIMSVSMVVGILCAILFIGMMSLKSKKDEYDASIDSLNKQIEAENKRTENLIEYEKYTKTSAYVEEVAKERLGLVYDDEIVFQPEE